MTADVLILNRNLFAIHVASWERALTLLYMDRARVVDQEYRTYDFKDWMDLSRQIKEHPAGFVSTPTLRIAVPEVIALNHYEKVPLREIPFTRRNIYQHYRNRCCYCGKRFLSSELNLEHILPRSRGGATDWNNVVTSCIPCNLKKGDLLPTEAGMRLKIAPSRPKCRPGAVLILRSPVAIRRSWQRFVDHVYCDRQLED